MLLTNCINKLVVLAPRYESNFKSNSANEKDFSLSTCTLHIYFRSTSVCVFIHFYLLSKWTRGQNFRALKNMKILFLESKAHIIIIMSIKFKYLFLRKGKYSFFPAYDILMNVIRNAIWMSDKIGRMEMLHLIWKTEMTVSYSCHEMYLMTKEWGSYDKLLFF
jgi:hypothetical protein